MPVSEDERHLVYEMLDIPNAPNVLNVGGDFGTGSKFQSHAVLVAKTEIDARLDALEEAPLARLQEIVAEWRRVAFDSTEIMPNTANEGVRVNPARTRGLLRKRLRSVLGVFRPHDLTGGDLLPG